MGGATRRNPWWIPPFLGRVPAEVPEAHVRLLGALAFAIYFENFDQALLTQAIKQIAADFAVAESSIGSMLGFVRLGAIPAFLLVPFADRIGRRRLFLVSVAGMSLGTTCAALAQEPVFFVACQMLARAFMVTAAATAFVIVSEELAAPHRGWGIGILGAVGAFGVGLSAALFAAIEHLPWGWRTMYLLGVVPILLLPWLRGRVTETRRFARHRASSAADAAGAAGWWRPLALLYRAHPGRALAIGLIGFAQTAAVAGAYNFSSYFVQTVHGWEPGHYALMLGIAGIGGVIGHPIAGRLADRRGRRAVGVVFLGVFPLMVMAFYRGPGWTVPLAWVPMIFALTGSETIIRALATELFPTALRGTASGWLQLCSTLGAAAGLFAVSLGTPAGGSSIPAVQVVGCAAWLAALVVWRLPETGGRELEEIHAT
jgi:putative MFS transporter